MRTRALLLIVASILLSICQVVAQTPQCDQLQNSRMVVVFGNGVLTTENEARFTATELAKRLSARLEQGQFESLGFTIAYNDSQGFVLDLFESVKQRLTADFSSFWRYLAGVDLLPDFFQDAVQDIVSSVDAQRYINDEDLQEHIACYRFYLSQDKKIITVAHSQGNFYANEAFNFLTNVLNTPIEEGTFKIVSIANPASFVAGVGPYTTLIEDLVIEAVTIASSATNRPLPLPPNTANEFPPCGHDSLCHKFLDTYLNGINSGPRILGHIVDAISTPPPEPRIWNEDFEGLNLGEISGQGQWVAFAGDGTVDNSQAFTGSQSLRLDNGGTRLLMPGGFLSGFGSMVTSYLRIGTIGSDASGAMYFNDHQIAESPVTLSCTLGHTFTLGHIRFNDEVLKEIAENTWYKLDVELDYSANRCRGRVDNESWSGWQNILPGNRPLHVAFIGSIGFAQSSTHEVWFDDLSVSGPAISE